MSKLYPTASMPSASSVSEAIPSAFVKPPPRFISQNEKSDYLSRAITDIESDDTATRRNARVRLSQLLAQNMDSDEVNNLINGLANSSYRYKLGVAVAISNLDKKLYLSPSAAKILNQQALSEKDLTLKSNLKGAQKMLEVK